MAGRRLKIEIRNIGSSMETELKLTIFQKMSCQNIRFLKKYIKREFNLIMEVDNGYEVN